MNQHNEKISEDSLYLNVWLGATSDQEKLPVLVYIHGGTCKKRIRFHGLVQRRKHGKKGSCIRND
ncbi:carboxylesterase family protein [Paenibacillus taichungensis]|uniref:carboxylesterase family protein n=1 Tax=Paenibacillus TaxID=44249 RepID=UPI00352345A5